MASRDHKQITVKEVQDAFSAIQDEETYDKWAELLKQLTEQENR